MKVTLLSTVELRKELAKREKQITLLKTKKNRLSKRIEKIDAQIAAMEGQAHKPYAKKAGKKKTGRAKALRGRAGSLPNVLFEVMKDKKALKVSEAAMLAQKAGYKSKSKTYVKIVGKALKADKRFKKVGRGMFQVR